MRAILGALFGSSRWCWLDSSWSWNLGLLIDHFVAWCRLYSCHGHCVVGRALALVSAALGWWVYPRAIGDDHDPGWFVLMKSVVKASALHLMPWFWVPGLAGSRHGRFFWHLRAFRLFDITKPWPVCRFERLNGATGVMVDDVAAGILGAALLLPMSMPH